jgi:hypothetical protein
MHVELAHRRCEAVRESGSRRVAECVAGEVEPSHGSRIVYMKIIFGACRDRAGLRIPPRHYFRLVVRVRIPFSAVIIVASSKAIRS